MEKNATLGTETRERWEDYIDKYVNFEHAGDTDTYKGYIRGCLKNHLLVELAKIDKGIWVEPIYPGEANIIIRNLESRDKVAGGNSKDKRYNENSASNMYGIIKRFYGFVGDRKGWESNPFGGVGEPRINKGKSNNRNEKPTMPAKKTNKKAVCAPFQLEKHDANSLKSLIYLISSKGELLSKSTGGEFFASDKLVETLQTGDLGSTDEVIAAIQEMGEGDLKGVSFEDDKVIMDGFPETDDEDTKRAWSKLGIAMNYYAIDHKNIRPAKTKHENERYTFYGWLGRLGFRGMREKIERMILYKNLNGSVAFRTEDVKARWIEKHGRGKKDE